MLLLMMGCNGRCDGVTVGNIRMVATAARGRLGRCLGNAALFLFVRHAFTSIFVVMMVVVMFVHGAAVATAVAATTSDGSRWRHWCVLCLHHVVAVVLVVGEIR